MPIHAYVGPNGGGKSLAMVYDTLPSLRAGRRVLSTVRLLDYDWPRQCDDDGCQVIGHPRHAAAHPLYVPFTDYRQLLVWRGGDVLMDEVTGVASARESMSLPAPVANYLVQLRRRDVLLRWTSPNWARADKIMREVSQGVTHCLGYLPATRAQGEHGDRVWRDRRVFFWRTYDANAFDEFTAHKRQTVRPKVMQLFVRSRSEAQRAYDTLDAVSALGASSEGGYCITCGGRRTAPRCSCPDQVSTRPVRRAARTPRSGEDGPAVPSSATVPAELDAGYDDADGEA
jgi:hypothetical protein